MTNEYLSESLRYHSVRQFVKSLGIDYSKGGSDFMVLCKKYGLEAYKSLDNNSNYAYYVGRGDDFIGLVEPPGSEEQLLVLLLTAEANPR